MRRELLTAKYTKSTEKEGKRKIRFQPVVECPAALSGAIAKSKHRRTYRDHIMKFQDCLLFLVSIRPLCRSGYSTTRVRFNFSSFIIHPSAFQASSPLPHTPPCNNTADRRTWRAPLPSWRGVTRLPYRSNPCHFLTYNLLPRA